MRQKEEIINLKSTNDELIEESVVYLSNTKELLSERIIDEKYLNIKKNNVLLDYESSFAFIYGFAYYRNEEFETMINDINMGLDIVKKDTLEVEEHYKLLKDVGYEKSLEISKDANVKINDHLNLTLSLQRNVIASFKELRDIYLNQISMTAFAPTMKKNTQELKELGNRIVNKIRENKDSLDKTYEYIYYHSGDKITKLVKKMVQATKLINERQNLDIHHESYYLNSDCIITLEVKEWTDLYNKVKFVFKMLTNIDVNTYNEIKDLFEDFETDYMIVLLYEEMDKLK